MQFKLIRRIRDILCKTMQKRLNTTWDIFAIGHGWKHQFRIAIHDPVSEFVFFAPLFDTSEAARLAKLGVFQQSSALFYRLCQMTPTELDKFEKEY